MGKISHVVTAQDLANNPKLATAGVKEGDAVMINLSQLDFFYDGDEHRLSIGIDVTADREEADERDNATTTVNPTNSGRFADSDTSTVAPVETSTVDTGTSGVQSTESSTGPDTAQKNS